MIRHFLIQQGTAGGFTLQQTEWIELARFTDTTQTITFTLPDIYDRFGLFLVGGGAGGAGDNSNAGAAGNGGNGGQVQSFIFDKSNNIDTITITVGAGGQGGTKKGRTGKKGGDTTATYNSQTFTALGGLKTPNTSGSTNNSQLPSSPYQALGGTHLWATKKVSPFNEYQAYHKASYDKYPGSNVNNAMGDDGYANPFNPEDTNLYGAGGAGAFSVYTNSGAWDDSDKTAILGGTTGGGNSGYGDNNATTNHGQDGQFYGAGGGGAAFSSNHNNSIGGNGYNGIAILYGKAPKPKMFILQDNI